MCQNGQCLLLACTVYLAIVMRAALQMLVSSYLSDTMALCLQGLNIAPALIVVAPTKEIVNPVGPLAISDTLIEDEVPALP